MLLIPKPDMKLYPLRLTSVNKDILWGGYRLAEEYGKPKGKLAEAWELAVHPEGVNIIENGPCAGMTLSDYLGGDRPFPIMIKLIDACDRLSVQVHPVKTEMWYIVDCKEGASLVYGLKEAFDETTFRAALASKTTEKLLNFVPVHKGDVFFIPQGMVHAIGEGILIAEIQENSNVTYRVYDYDRLQNGKPRQLHVDEAMKTVKDFTDGQVDALRFVLGRGDSSTLANCPSFRVDRYTVDGILSLTADEGFLSVICLDGNAAIGGKPMGKGDSYFLPEGLGKTDVVGTCEIIVTSCPSQINQ